MEGRRKVWPDDYIEEGADKGILCPKCGCRHSRIAITRETYGNRRRRVRICRHCGTRYCTFESR